PVRRRTTARGRQGMTKRDDVREFMLSIDQPVRTEPTDVCDIEKWDRYARLTAESSAHKKALADPTKATAHHAADGTRQGMTDPADGLRDMVYIILGTAHSYGFDVDELWRLVHENNTSKIGPETGLVLKVNGKVQKPEGFVPVDLRSSIYPPKH